MTALCGGGTSAPKAGSPLVVAIGVAAMLSYISGWGSKAAFLSNFLSFVNIPDLDLATFCASDPPAIPTFDLADAGAIASLPVGSPQMAITAGKVADLIKHLAWYELCECTSGTLTALPAPADPPTGTGSPAPLPSSGPCKTEHMGPNVQPTPNGLITGPSGQFPVGCTWFRCINTQVNNGGAGTNYHSDMYLNNQYGQRINNNALLFRAIRGTTTIDSYTRDPNMEYYFLDQSFFNSVSGNVDTLESTWEFYCGSAAPTGVNTGCCPPDDVTLGLLQSILNMVTLIQRQEVPFAYIPGAAHSGLSGTGEIDVQGLIGAKITASVPGRAGVDLGNPDVVYDIGWINWGNADGFIPREKLVTSPQLSFPNAAGSFTKIGYSIPSDVTITILELVREAP